MKKSQQEAMEQKGISRRNFLVGAGLAAAGAASLSMMGCASSQSKPLAANMPEKWDYEADVVVVGLGAAGLAAAISAKMDGVEKVLALEAAPEEHAGGSTRVSGDALMIPDAVKEAAMYQTKLNSYYEVPEEYMTAWAQGVYDNKEWLSDELGYDLQRTSSFSPEFPGIEGGDVIKGYYVDGICGYSSLWNPMMESAIEYGVEVMYEMRATDLVFDYETKEVFGLIASGKSVKALKGVVLACGGFSANKEMLRNYGVVLGAPDSWFLGTPYNMGDGIKMAQQIGADLWHMNSYAATSTCVRTVSPDSQICNIPYPTGADFIYVNQEGQRYTYEEKRVNVRHGKTKERGIWPLLTVPSGSHMIMGSKSGVVDMMGKTPYMSWSDIMGVGLTTNKELLDAGIMVQADTIEELAKKLNYNPETLKKTVETYNQNAANNVDPDFNRGTPVYGDYSFDAISVTDGSESGELHEVIKAFDLEPLTPPFYAVEIGLGLLNTQGGAKRNGESQVLDLEGNPIPRLYSAGEFGSIYGYMYNGGGNVSEAVSTGRIAGSGCAALESWDKKAK